MESNGKSVDIEGQTLKMPASPIIWGEVGTNAQHSFFQFLHYVLCVELGSSSICSYSVKIGRAHV